MGILLKELVELNEAIDAYGYLETPTTDESVLVESLQVHILKNDMPRIFQIPIGKIFATLKNADVFPLMREYNRKLSDYKITGKDAALTLNKMKVFIYINGTNEEKELLSDKLTSLEKKVAASYKKNDNEYIDIPYGSIKSFYSLYKRIEKRSTLKEDSLRVKQAKYAKKYDPDEYVIKDTYNRPMAGKATRGYVFHGDDSLIKDIAQRRLDKVYEDPELKKVAEEIKRELKKPMLDHSKIMSLLDRFKLLYKYSGIKKEVNDDLKIEKINNKRKAASLYEHILEEYIDKFSSQDIENDNNLERITFLSEELSKEAYDGND